MTQANEATPLEPELVVLPEDALDVDPRLAGRATQAGSPKTRILLANPLNANDWEDLTAQRRAARDLNVEGVMLKRRDAPYVVGRKKGNWWKWKIEPLTVDAVLIYAQRGSGKRASLYTDYTFGVWDDGKLFFSQKLFRSQRRRDSPSRRVGST